MSARGNQPNSSGRGRGKGRLVFFVCVGGRGGQNGGLSSWLHYELHLINSSRVCRKCAYPALLEIVKVK